MTAPLRRLVDRYTSEICLALHAGTAGAGLGAGRGARAARTRCRPPTTGPTRSTGRSSTRPRRGCCTTAWARCSPPWSSTPTTKAGTVVLDDPAVRARCAGSRPAGGRADQVRLVHGRRRRAPGAVRGRARSLTDHSSGSSVPSSTVTARPRSSTRSPRSSTSIPPAARRQLHAGQRGAARAAAPQNGAERAVRRTGHRVLVHADVRARRTARRSRARCRRRPAAVTTTPRHVDRGRARRCPAAARAPSPRRRARRARRPGGAPRTDGLDAQCRGEARRRRRRGADGWAGKSITTRPSARPRCAAPRCGCGTRTGRARRSRAARASWPAWRARTGRPRRRA